MNQFKSLLLLLASLCCGSCSVASSQQSNAPAVKKAPAVESRVSGKMTYKGITTKLNHVYAQDARDLLDEGEAVEEVDILLSERSLSAIEPDKQIPYAVKIQFGKEGLQEAQVYVNGDSVAIIYFSSPDCPPRSGTAKFVGGVIEGSLRLSPSNCTKGGFDENRNLAFEASFKAAIQPPDDKKIPVTTRTGKPLPQGGGEAGKVGAEFFATLIESGKLMEEVQSTPPTAADEKQRQEEQETIIVRKIEGFLPAGRKVESTEDVMRVAMLGGLEKYEIGNGFSDGKKATLEIKALRTIIAGVRVQTWVGKVNMMLENGQWKVLRVGMKEEESEGGEIYW